MKLRLLGTAIMPIFLASSLVRAATLTVTILGILAHPVFAATHTVTFIEDDLIFSEVGGYDRVHLRDGAYLTEFGKPQLPTKALRVVVPPGTRVTAVTIDKASKKKLEGYYLIAPAQEMEMECRTRSEFVEPHPGIYGQTSEYPGGLVTRVGESYIDGVYEVAHLLVYPLQYVPITGELYLYRSITFTLTLEKAGADVPHIKARTESSKQSSDLMLRETVINPEDLDAYGILPEKIRNNVPAVQQLELMLTPASIGLGPAEYIIITSDTTMADTFMPLVDWRIKKGITSEIVTVPWIESNYNGVDIQEKIKNFIYDSYINRGTKHVLLGGTSDLVPVRYAYIYHYDSQHNGEAATDLYYSNCSVGDEEWVVHEGPLSPTPHVTYNPPDGSSINALLPRVNVGRLLVADEAQAMDVINKILTYERRVPATDYQQTFLYHGADDGGLIQYQDFVDEAVPDYLRSFTRTLISDGLDADDRSTPENIVSFMTGGSDLGVPFNFAWSVSHASPYLLTTDSSGFTSNHIDQIINEPRYNGSFYAWGCTTAPIESVDPSILAAKWVNIPNGGGVAWIGASIVAGGDRGVWHTRYYHEEMWEDSDDYHHFNLGQAFTEAKSRMIENFPDPPFDPSLPRWATTWAEYHAIIWNLVGDPLVPLSNHFPRPFDVSASPNQVTAELATTLDITVKDGGYPVEGALVAVMKLDEDVYLNAFTDANGSHHFELPPLSITSDIDVTVTKHNYRPHEDVLTVSDATLVVAIDIKPGNKKNVINPRAKGNIWVAVLSDTGSESPFDSSSQVDIPTVEFGPDGAKANRHKVKDINKDGLGDLLLRFKIPKTGIACGDTEAALTGETFEGQSFTGTDDIKAVGCKPKKSRKKHHDDDRDDDKKHHGKHKEKKYHDRDHDDDHKKR